MLCPSKYLHRSYVGGIHLPWRGSRGILLNMNFENLFKIGLGGSTISGTGLDPKKTWFRAGTGSKRFKENIRIKENNKTYGLFKLR